MGQTQLNMDLSEKEKNLLNMIRELEYGELKIIVGHRHQGSIVTLVDRKSRFVTAQLLPDRRCGNVATVINNLLAGFVCHSITVDNGKEFAKFAAIENDLDTSMYFCHPHSPWERGTNENTNGLLREFYSKSFDFKNTSQSKLNNYLWVLNNRPRKCLGWKTPVEVFTQCCT